MMLALQQIVCCLLFFQYCSGYTPRNNKAYRTPQYCVEYYGYYVCPSNYCEHNGVCSCRPSRYYRNSYIPLCTCPSYTRGDRCQIVDNPCGEHGMYIWTKTGDYVCKCDDGFEGQKFCRPVEGEVYTRWGRNDCPDDTSTLVYSGYVASIKYDEKSNGGNYICLTSNPEFDTVLDRTQRQHGKIWGANFEFDRGDDDKNFDDRAVTCAKCRLKGAKNYVRIAGTRTCPDGYRTEYQGYLNSNNNDRGATATTEYICVDEDPQLNEVVDDDGARLARVEAICAPGGRGGGGTGRGGGYGGGGLRVTGVIGEGSGEGGLEGVTVSGVSGEGTTTAGVSGTGTTTAGVSGTGTTTAGVSEAAAVTGASEAAAVEGARRGGGRGPPPAGSLDCSVYGRGDELTCVICSK